MDEQAPAKTDTRPIHQFIPLGVIISRSAVKPDQPTPPDWTEITNGPQHAQERVQLPIETIIKRLLNARWIRVFSRITDDSTIYRIFLLPNDVGRISVSRNSKGLRADLEQLLDNINISERAWSRTDRHHVEKFCPWATAEPGSLFYLFNTLPSPKPNPSNIQDRFTRTAVEELLDIPQPIPGLKTLLYPYQARSAAAMLQREASTELHLDPRFEKRIAPDGSPYYLIPRELYFSQTPPMYQSNRCGILAETMGLGKTIICLAAILSTKYHMPPIPPEYLPESIERESVPTLLDIAISIAGRAGIPAKAHFDRVRRVLGDDHTTCVTYADANPPVYFVPGIAPRNNRRTQTPPPKKMTICSATIIVVPRNLVHQWKSEINKHVSDGPDGLKVLILDAPSCEVPPAEQLRHYDVVLFSKPRFDREIQHGNDRFGRNTHNTFLECHCPYIGATRIRDCTCLRTSDVYHSPLQDLHWLRIIIDEGHEFSSSTSNSVLVAQKLVTAERRWIVSGTPARDKLFGIEVDVAIDEDELQLANDGVSTNGTDEALESDPSTPMSTEAPSLSTPLQSLVRSAALERRKQFNAREELGTSGASKSIGLLVNHFLQVRPWAAAIGERRAEWDDFIFCHDQYRMRTHNSFSGCFRRTLESLVIKTQPEDVEKDIVLPPLTHKVVRLEPSYYDKLTANLFILFLTSNAVCSERTDQDYIFHKNSAKERYQLITNLRQSNLFWTGFSTENILSAVDTSKKYLNKPDIKCSDEDRNLLSCCIEFAQLVLNSPGWQAMSAYHEIGLFLRNWPQESKSNWTLNEDSQSTMLGASQLILAQGFVNGQLLDEEPLKGLDRAGEVAMTKLKADSQEDGIKRKRNENQQDSKVGVPDSAVHSEPLASKRHFAPTPKKFPRSEVKKASLTPTHSPSTSTPQALFPDVPTQESVVPSPVKLSRKRGREIANYDLPLDSQLCATEIIGTVSAKISYLLDRVVEFHATEKIIIFYDGNNAAFYLAQCLDLLHIKYLIYAKSLTNEQKSRYIVSFDVDDSIRVLLMDIRSGAFGLNVNKASRVYFINPVCRPSTEAQAIKRAHRIGQTKPVHVETLVLKGTIEEAIFERSNRMTQSEHQEAGQLSDDRGVTHIIQTVQTLPVASEEGLGAAQMAPLAHPLQVFGRKGRGDTTIRGIDAEVGKSTVPRKKPKKVPVSQDIEMEDEAPVPLVHARRQSWNHVFTNPGALPSTTKDEVHRSAEPQHTTLPSIFG